MTEHEYVTELKDIIDKLQKKQTEGVENRLDELYKYKPVRLLWHVAHAYLMFAQGDPTGGMNDVSPYCRFGLHNQGCDEFAQFHKDILKKWGIAHEIKRTDYVYADEEERAEGKEEFEKAYAVYRKEGTEECLADLTMQYYYMSDIIPCLILSMWLEHIGFWEKDVSDSWYFKIKNYDYLEAEVIHSQVPFLLIEEKGSSRDCNLLAEVLSGFGHPVYLLAAPIEVEGDVHSREVLDLCLENVQEYEESIVIPVCETIMPDGHRENNRAELIQYLYCNEFEQNFGILLTSGTIFYSLLENNLIQKHIECLSEIDHLEFLDNMYFGWVGNYLAYISDIYESDAEKCLLEKTECDFSIVVPARNSAGTLYYTLQTCLKQDYKGTYEIIVSDNSTEGREEVYQVCKDLNDSRIRYVKTPRNLPLGRSFEFAFLQARGEFIFSIGSDDGVCPWALSMLKDILLKYPDEEVIQWIRGFYGWSDFQSGSADKLVIPGKFVKGKPEIYYEERMEYFARVLKDSSWVFSMPNLYLNSGFRRSYLVTLLETTGRLWDGANQDMYMGVVGAAIHNKILNVKYPFTIAGMSNNSMGYVISKPTNRITTDSKEKDIKQSSINGDNMGLYAVNGILKTDLPIGTGQTCALYYTILRAVQLGLLPEEWRRELIKDKEMFLKIISEYSILDDNFDLNIHYARNLAKQKGEQFLKWFDNTIYNKVIQPKFYDPADENKTEISKDYQEGPTEGGGLAIDASNYGVTNIAEAMDLFEQWIGWTPGRWQQELKKRKESKQ